MSRSNDRIANRAVPKSPPAAPMLFRFVRDIGNQFRNPLRYVFDHHSIAMRQEVVAHGAKPVAVLGPEIVQQPDIPAKHARQRSAPVEETQGVFGADYIKKLPLRGVALGQQVEVLEELVLPDRLRPAAPVDEFEFGDTRVGFKVEGSAGVPRAEGNIIDNLVHLQNVRQAKQNAHGVDGYIDLSGHAFQGRRRRQHSGINPRGAENPRAIGRCQTANFSLDLGERGSQVLADEGLQHGGDLNEVHGRSEGRGSCGLRVRIQGYRKSAAGIVIRSPNPVSPGGRGKVAEGRF